MEAAQRRVYERVSLVLLFLGPLLALVGVVVAASPYERYHTMSTYVAVLGIGLTAASIGMFYPIKELRTMFRKHSLGEKYDEMRYLGHLKASAILLNLLWLLGLVGLFMALAIRADLLTLQPSRALTTRLSAFGAIAIMANITHVHYLSLRIPTERQRHYPVFPFLLLGFALTAVFTLLALFLIARPSVTVLGGLTFDRGDVLLFLLAGTVFCSIDLVIARPLPNLLTLFQSGTLGGTRDYVSKAKSIILPAVTAFGLLFLVLFLLLAVGVGTTGVRSPIQMFVFAFIGLAMVLSIFFSLRLARSEDVYELYHIRPSRETRTGKTILGVTLSIAGILAIAALYLLRGGHISFIGPPRWIDLLSFGLLIGLGPYGFYHARRMTRIRRLEERFPDFLRDVAASHRGGLTLTASVQIAAKGEYGELTPEIRKMADQLSWNVPFNEALSQLMQRVNTPLIERAITLIIEASRSGGSTTDVLLAAARDAREIKNLENERRQTMGLYSVIIYITFFVFLVVAAVLYGQLVPEIIKSAEAAARSNVQGSAAGINLNTPSKLQYRAFYFMAAVMQGIGNGLVGGLFQSGKVLAGLRHSFLMVLITYVTFTFIFP